MCPNLKIICIPDVRVFPREVVAGASRRPSAMSAPGPAASPWLILACDGLWDVFSSQDIMNQLYLIAEEGESNVQLLAEELIDVAIKDKGTFIYFINFIPNAFQDHLEILVYLLNHAANCCIYL